MPLTHFDGGDAQMPGKAAKVRLVLDALPASQQAVRKREIIPTDGRATPQIIITKQLSW
jgi:hypothetical protein